MTEEGENGTVISLKLYMVTGGLPKGGFSIAADLNQTDRMEK